MISIQYILTKKQREKFLRIPMDISDWDIAKYYTFTKKELEIIGNRRRQYNKIGFALQLSSLKHPGWSLSKTKQFPLSVILYIAQQIKVHPAEICKYPKKKETLSEHFVQVKNLFGYRNFEKQDEEWLFNTILDLALENDNPQFLMKCAIVQIRNKQIILPGITSIEKIIKQASLRSERVLYEIILENISPSQKKKIDRLINEKKDHNLTILGWLREYPGKVSPNSFLHVLERYNFIKEIGLNIELEKIHPNKVRQLFYLAERYKSFSFRRFKERKRHALLVICLIMLLEIYTDRLLDIHNFFITGLYSRCKNKHDEIQLENGKAINNNMLKFIEIGSAIIEARENKNEPFEKIDSLIPWESFKDLIADSKTLTRPSDYDYLDLFKNYYYQIRRYSPALLKNFIFIPGNTYSRNLISALKVIHKLNESGNRKLPDKVPTGFISKRWSRYVFKDNGDIDKAFYEISALTELKNSLRAGNISVSGSKQYKSFDEYLISKSDWKMIRRNIIPYTYKKYIKSRKMELYTRIKYLSNYKLEIDGFHIKDGKLHIDRLEKYVPDKAKLLSKKLYSLLPRIKLTDLLMEVSTWTNFYKDFIHLGTGKKPDESECELINATLMALATNMGLTNMDLATPGITFHQMANVIEWRVYDKSIEQAHSRLISYQKSLKLTQKWGKGRTSSSDGMRVPVQSRSLHSSYNPHYGNKKGATIYRFTSDNYSPFYTKIIYTNSRDAAYIIDGLLFHNTDLEIEEHYGDTAAYTNQIFALCHFLGFRFAPRIRNIPDQKLFRIDKIGDPELKKAFKSKANFKLIENNYDEVFRLIHSIRTGKSTCIAIMNKLGSYSRTNPVANALKEMGRIEKTVFLLDYLCDKELRKKIQRGLNKSEAMNALARAVFFWRHGEFRERKMREQLNRASALNIVINAIIIWNTVYLEKAIRYLKSQNSLDETLLEFIAPLGWGHINLLGEYRFKRYTGKGYRSLRKSSFY